METVLDRFLKSAFRRSTRLADRSVIVAFSAAFLGIPLSFTLYKATGAVLFSLAGNGCVLVAIAGAMISFLGQSTNQTLRAAAKANGKEPGYFEGEKPLLKPIIDRFIEDRFGAVTLTRGTRTVSNASTFNRRTHNNTRSYRRAPRPTFTRASSSSGGSSDDGSDSGSSDDPPEHEHSVTPPNFPEKSGSKLHPWRRPGSCRVPTHFGLGKGWSAWLSEIA